MSERKKYFTHIFKNNGFNGKISRSGPGSEGVYAERKALFLREAVKRTGSKTLLDIGCGDFHWMRRVVDLLDIYTGMDIVRELVDKNNYQYADDKIIFAEMDLMQMCAPTEDMVVCIDVTQHLTNDELDKLIELLMKSKRFIINIAPNEEDFIVGRKTRWQSCDIRIHPKFKADVVDAKSIAKNYQLILAEPV